MSAAGSGGGDRSALPGRGSTYGEDPVVTAESAATEDAAVTEEITLTAEVIIAANDADGMLSREEIDRLLGVQAG